MTAEPVTGAAETVLEAVRAVVADLHAGQAARYIDLDSSLARDAGLDSLAMAEVLTRLEDAFGVPLPASLLATAETPRDLLRAVTAGDLRQPGWAPPETAAPVAALSTAPATLGTLPEVLAWHAANHPDRRHLRVIDDTGATEDVRYVDLLQASDRTARGLLSAGVAPGDKVALMLPTGWPYFQAFAGVMAAGAVPVPIYPPARPSALEEHLRRHVHVLTNAGAVALVTDTRAQQVAKLLRKSIPALRRVVTVDELGGGGHAGPLPAADPDAPALIQYTSGSTAAPKGVVLSHRNVLANIAAMGEAAETSAADTFVSWLPLYHDMGLIGAWLSGLVLGYPSIILSPLTFLRRPYSWLAALSEYHGTLTTAPNFAYELCLRKVSEAEVDQLDLSALRMSLNGAEPVSATTMQRFAERFARCGLRPGALAPVYGLAECGVGLTFPPLDRGLLVDTIEAETLRKHARAVPAERGRPGTRAVVACGRPLPGYDVRVVGPGGQEVREREEGRIQFRGPSATAGYYRNPTATEALLHDGWLDTGDLGYLAGGDLYPTGRSKDVVIRAGRNIHPEDLEVAIGQLAGVRQGCVAAFSARDPTVGTEQFVVVAETREEANRTRADLQARIAAVTVDVAGTSPDVVLLTRPGAVPKTSSGKIRRAACAERFSSGTLDRQPPPAWWQFLSFGARAYVWRIRGGGRALVAVGYASYGWLVFAAVAAPTLVMLAVLPGQRSRQRLVHAAARSLRILTGIRLTVDGADLLPRDQPCVVVSNHGSWVDALLLAGWLPAGFTFVAGEVLGRQRLAGFLLRRIGADFVERETPGQAVADSARLSVAARHRSLVVFPEGGLSRSVGVRPFHLGAFLAAAQAGRPVVPIAIRGTRRILPPGHPFLRHGRTTVTVTQPLHPAGSGWPAVVELHRTARAALLAQCGEPDLG
jgi:1-acyl-sn-glycerol-3-phosphate acyltransferase